jgi:hypothetical protein
LHRQGKQNEVSRTSRKADTGMILSLSLDSMETFIKRRKYPFGHFGKKTILFSTLLAISLLNTSGLRSQSKERETEREHPGVIRPASYDSTKSLEEQYKPENQYEFIGLQLYLPPVINPQAGPVVFSKHSKDFVKGNRYYTITDILQGDAAAEIRQKKLINQCGYRYKDLETPQSKELIIFTVFVLRDNDKTDTLNNAPLYWLVCESKIQPYSCSSFNSFISTPYFEKQKQLYLNQDVIQLSDKSRWVCKNVSLVKCADKTGTDSIYDIFCLLVNSKGEQMQLRPPSEKYGRNFMTWKEYDRMDHADRNMKMEMYKEDNEKKEKRKADCISKFGQANGELVAAYQIKTGMTEAMCLEAWGKPWDITKSTNKTGTKEIWHYNWKYNLHFEKGVLMRFDH